MPLDDTEYTGDPILAVIDRVDRLICDEEHWGIGICDRTTPVPSGMALDGVTRHCPVTAIYAARSSHPKWYAAFGYFKSAARALSDGRQDTVAYNNAPERTFPEIKSLIRKARELRLADIMETVDA